MKLHVKSLLSDDAVEHVYDLSVQDEMNRLLELYPQLNWAMAHSNDWHVIAETMAHWLNGHHMDAWVTL